MLLKIKNLKIIMTGNNSLVNSFKTSKNIFSQRPNIYLRTSDYKQEHLSECKEKVKNYFLTCLNVAYTYSAIVLK